MVIKEDPQLYTLADSLDGSCITFDKRTDAEGSARHARAYVKLHGDIDLQSFPYAWDQELTYAEYHAGEWRERAWYYGDNPPKNLFGSHHIRKGEEHLPVTPQPEWTRRREAGLE